MSGLGSSVASPGLAMATMHLVARVDGERFAFPIGEIEEALDEPRVASVPLAPPGLLGQLPYRDRMIRAFDAAWVLGLSRVRPAAGAGTALVFRAGDERLALVVDDVEDLVAVAREDVRPVPAGADGEGVLRGVVVGDVHGGLVSLVSVDALLERAKAPANFALRGGT